MSRIILYRRVSSTGDPFLLLVCQGCMAAFRWNCQTEQPVGVIDEGPKTAEYRSQISYSLVAGCDDNSCESLVELVAIRPAGTTEEQCRQEVARWKLDQILCANGHQIVRPIPEPKMSI